ncbi:MAG: (Fe-S)-binding protein [Candidatus Hodarchaeota archaeon]
MGNTFYFHGCLTRAKFEREKLIGEELIRSIDPEIIIDEDFPCCGSFLFQHGTDGEIKSHIEKVTKWLKDKDIDTIITACAGCYHYFQDEYSKYLENFKDQLTIKHVIQHISELEKEGKLPFELQYGGEDKLKLTYHDACHLKSTETPIIEEPRQIISKVRGKVKYKDTERTRGESICCGSGGGVRALFSEVKDYNTSLVLGQARKKMAKIVLTGCPFCYLSMNEAGDRIKPMKFEEFLNKIRKGEAFE